VEEEEGDLYSLRGRVRKFMNVILRRYKRLMIVLYLSFRSRAYRRHPFYNSKSDRRIGK
jgi:hypothetical protein